MTDLLLWWDFIWLGLAVIFAVAFFYLESSLRKGSDE